MRWLVGIVAAAALGGVAYALGFGSEVAYVVRAVTRHVVGYR
jgi:hypothetical protein